MSLPFATCTVVIPCYRGADCVGAAVESVRAQTMQDYHIVLVDDKSPDNMLQTLRSLAERYPKISVVELPENKGRCCARNVGTRMTRGPYVCFLDQDDTYHPDFLRVTTYGLDSRPGLDAVKCIPKLNVELDLIRYSSVAHSLCTTMLIRRGVFEFLGGFPETQAFRDHPGGCEDLAFQQLFSQLFNLAVVEQQLYNYNYRPGNALDLFINRTRVEDGKIIFADGPLPQDELVSKEMKDMAQVLRTKVRQILVDRMKSAE